MYIFDYETNHWFAAAPGSKNHRHTDSSYEKPAISGVAHNLLMASVDKPLLLTTDSNQDTDASSSVSQPNETPWTSIYICGFCAIIQAVQFSIYFSSMWPYLISLDPSMPETMLGYIVAMYSLAQCIGAPTFGFWSNRIEQVRLPLITGFCGMMLGNMTYLCVQFVPIPMVPFFMMIARFITGSGTGNATLLRTYVASTSTLSDRSRAISCVTGGIAIGSMVGPGLQLLFTPLGQSGFYLGPFLLNIYTAPAALAILMNITGIVLITRFFEEKKVVYETLKGESRENTIPLDILAIGLCIFTRFIQIYTLTTIETVGSPYTIMMFSLTKEEAVTWNSAVHAASGVLAAIFYVFFIIYDFNKFLSERISCIITMFTLLSMFFATFSYPLIGQQVPPRINGSDYGCDFDRFDWCTGLTSTPIWLFYGFYILVFGLCFSFLNIAMTTLYSKIIGPRKQGTLQGIFQMSGSMGRLLSPLSMSYVYTFFGPRIVWSLEIVFIIIVIIVWYILYGRMVPFNERRLKERTEESEM